MFVSFQRKNSVFGPKTDRNSKIISLSRKVIKYAAVEVFLSYKTAVKVPTK
jgi:hypothetical protein